MTSITVAHRRRRRRKALVITAAVAASLLFFFRNYVGLTVNILFRGPFIAHEFSEPLHISQERDNFDITFDSYSREPVVKPNMSMAVPPILHHILLGTPKTSANLTAARATCIAMHPGYKLMYWTDDNAAEFVFKHYPELFTTWSSYRYTIQKADSLRYMVLHAFGGIFLDLDLECRRPLEQLRQFDFVAPAAMPMGISNGFLMVSPGHPFMKFVMDNLPRYNINWFGIPYAIVMFSTGCHFLSTMQALFPDRNNLRILWGPNKLHQLSGAVTTPLFRHLGSSSWHNHDSWFIMLFKPGHPFARLLGLIFSKTFLCLSIVVFAGLWWRSRAIAKRRGRFGKLRNDDEKELIV